MYDRRDERLVGESLLRRLLLDDFYITLAKSKIQCLFLLLRNAISCRSLQLFFLLFEVGYTLNSQLLPYPNGREGIFWSKVRFEDYPWGYNELSQFLERELSGKMPAISFDAKYKFLDTLRLEALEEGKKKNLKLFPAVIVYDDTMNNLARLWTLDRLHVYHAWPVIRTATYYNFIENVDKEYFKKAGINIFYVIYPTDKVLLKGGSHETVHGRRLQEELTKKNAPLRTIKNKRGEVVFHVYQLVQL